MKGPSDDSQPILLKFVQCLNPNCGLIKILTSGRGALAKHVCKVKDPNEFSSKKPTKDELDSLENRVLELIVSKLLPVDLMACKEMRALLQECVALGAKNGKVNLETGILPCSNTLTARLKSKGHAARQALVDDMREVIDDGLTSATVDGWTEPQHCRKFLAHTVSYVSEEFQYNDHVLFTPHCDADSVTAEVIQDVVNTAKEEITISADAEMHYVCDDGPDVVKASEGKSRSYCGDHATNLAVKKSLQLQLTKVDLYGAEAGSVLNKVETAVNIIKSSRQRNVNITSLKKKLDRLPPNRLKQTRFKSSLPMLQKVKGNFKQVRLCT